MTDVPQRARVVVIGGGVIGTSVAYHLAAQGCRDVVLLERDKLTSGTTWHAAGLMVTFGSLSSTATQMRQYTRSLYSRLEAETGLSTGFSPVGFIEVAADVDRLTEYRRIAAFNRHCGVDVHEISAREVGELFPLARVDDILAGFYVPDDGRANPVDVTMSLAKGARMRGVRVIESTPVTEVLHRRGVVTGVRTPVGDIEAEIVVNCAGMWARQLGADVGVCVPLQAAEHYYLITDAIDGVDRRWPVLEDPAAHGYYREESGGLMVGLFEPAGAGWRVDEIPTDFSFGTLPPDWDRMAPFLQRAMGRVPITLDAGVRTFFCGPESFTPDVNPIVGEAPELANYFVAAGLNSIGILSGGGIGRALAHWILTGAPDIDVTAITIDRFAPHQATPRYRADRVGESLGSVYQTHYPGRAMRGGRGARRTPLHERLAERGARFREVSGWEAADWFGAPDPTVDPIAVSEWLSWDRPEWFDRWADEHHAARAGVVIMDMSFMARFLVQGRDAGRALEWLSANRVDGEPGTITYTQWLNDNGTIEADVTVTKLDDDRFWVIATDTAHRHVLAWMRRQFARFDGGHAHVSVTDITSGFAQINLQGPKSRELLSTLTSADLTDRAWAFRGVREIDLGYARAVGARITYVGELGYELHVPADFAVHVHDELVAAGERFGLRHAGLRALGSLRLEKGYRDYGHDIDNLDTVWECGLGFAVALDKPGGFLGRTAAEAQRAAGPPERRLVQVLVTDPKPLMFHGEIVRRDGVAVGYLRSASYGFTLGGAVGLAMIDAGHPFDQSYLDSGEWSVEIAGASYPARVSLRPLYDPTNARIRPPEPA